MDHGGFVAPLDELAHGPAVDARGHELPHGRFAGPEGAGPEGVPPFAEQLRGEIPVGAGRLSSGAQGVPRKHRQEAPGPEPQAGNGDQSHLAILT